jgi:ribose 5-phosphate isomerase A
MPRGSLLGVGSGTTVDHFIRALAASDVAPTAVVSASESSTDLLTKSGIRVVELTDDVIPLPVYVDGADEVDCALRLIKGAGGALTREKVIAEASKRFVCIVDESKLVVELGAVPLPVEVVPMARHLVAARLVELGGQPHEREGFVTDNGNIILDVSSLRLREPEALENAIEAIPGVVTCGLFARRPADLLVVGAEGGGRTIQRSGHG